MLARIGNLELLARTVVDGFINGLHRAPFFGASIDFAEHRGYVPGDDIRRVDWRLYARTDQVLHQAVRSRHQHQLLDPPRRLEVDGVHERRAIRSSNTAATWRLPRLLGAPPARPRRHHHLRQRHRRLRAAVGEALRRPAAHARPLEGRSAPGNLLGAAQQDGRALQAAQHAGADLRLLRGARRRFSKRSSRCASSATI